MKLPLIPLGIVAVALGAAAAGMQVLLPAHQTTYTGYRKADFDDFAGQRTAMVKRYQRACATLDQGPMVEEVLEVKAGEAAPASVISYNSAGVGANKGTTVRTGIKGWKGFFTPAEQPTATDKPAGDYSDCTLITDENKSLNFPSALFTAKLPTLTPPADDSISWEARAATSAEADALTRAFEAARSELNAYGPAWKETTVYDVAATGVPTLQRAYLRYRHANGSQVTLEFLRVEGEPKIQAVLVAHRRLPGEKLAPKEKDADESASSEAGSPAN